MGILTSLNSSAVTASSISGVEIDIGFHNALAWGGILLLATAIICIVLSIITETEFNGVLPLLVVLVPGITMGVLGLLNISKEDAGVEEIGDHYGVSIATSEEEKVPGREVFGKEATRFTSVVIEHDYSKTEGSILSLDGDRWALVVEEGTESSGDFVEFDDFIAEEGNRTGVEELGSETD